MPKEIRPSCGKGGSSFKLYSLCHISFKISDLKKDVDSLKTTYECGSDPNKPRIGRVLSNMKRKIVTAEKIMKIGQNITHDRTRVLLGRVGTIKRLFRELMKDQCDVAKPDRRALCQMYHQILSMEDDLVHFTEPGHEQLGSRTCKNNEETPFSYMKDSEVQTTKNEVRFAPGVSNTPSPCKSKPRNIPVVYTGIETSRSKIDLIGESSPTVEETWATMLSNKGKQRGLQSSQDVPAKTLDSPSKSMISANDSLKPLYIMADDFLESSENVMNI